MPFWQPSPFRQQHKHAKQATNKGAHAAVECNLHAVGNKGLHTENCGNGRIKRGSLMIPQQVNEET